MNFYWFKTGEIESAYNGTKEGWAGDVLEPRPWAFMVKIFEEKTGCTIDDLYTRDGNEVTRTPEDLINLRISKLQAKADIMQKEREDAAAEPSGPLLPQYA